MTPLRYIRESLLGISIRELARLLGEHPTVVSRWDRGVRPCAHARVRPVLRALVEAAGHVWTDSLLFEAPVCDDCCTPGGCPAVCVRVSAQTSEAA
jgi:predicted transcriptional regulator